MRVRGSFRVRLRVRIFRSGFAHMVPTLALQCNTVTFYHANQLESTYTFQRDTSAYIEIAGPEDDLFSTSVRRADEVRQSTFSAGPGQALCSQSPSEPASPF